MRTNGIKINERKMKILCLTKYEDLGASSRLRTIQYAPELRKMNLHFTIRPLIRNAELRRRYQTGRYSFFSTLLIYLRRMFSMIFASPYDLIWIEKESLPWLPAWFERLLLKKKPYVLDFDDATFHNYDQHRSKIVRALYGNRLDILMRESQGVFCGNDYLSRRARQAGAATVLFLPTVVDLKRYPLKIEIDKNKRSSDRCRLVWIGTPATEKYLKQVSSALLKLSGELEFEIILIGGSKQNLDPSLRVKEISWSVDTEVLEIARCDIGIMPLVDEPFERGKCGYKLIQYMACGLPVVASPVGVNIDLVSQGENGFLASSDSDWQESLRRLIGDENLRKRFGENGRILVEENYSLEPKAIFLKDCLLNIQQDIN